MRLTDELKGKLENASSDEEAKKIIAETKKGVEAAGVILDDAELDQVAGCGPLKPGQSAANRFLY